MLDANLSNYAQDGYTHWTSSNLNINGTIYPSAYAFGMNINGTYIADTIAGNFSINASGAITGGIVTGYFEQVWNGSTWVEVSSTTGFSYSAVAIYNAAISGGAIGDYTD